MIVYIERGWLIIEHGSDERGYFFLSTSFDFLSFRAKFYKDMRTDAVTNDLRVFLLLKYLTKKDRVN